MGSTASHSESIRITAESPQQLAHPRRAVGCCGDRPGDLHGRGPAAQLDVHVRHRCNTSSSTQTDTHATGSPFRRTRTFAVLPACAGKPSSRGAICKPLLAAGAVALGLAGDEIAAAQNGSRAPQTSSAITRRGDDVNARCMARTSLKRLNVERCCWAAWSGRCLCEAVRTVLGMKIMAGLSEDAHNKKEAWAARK